MVYRVELIMDVDPLLADEFESVWLAVGKHVAAHPDNVAQWLSRSDDPPGRYVIVSDWPDQATFQRFETDPGHRAITSRLRSLRLAGSMTGMTVVHHLPGQAAA